VKHVIKDNALSNVKDEETLKRDAEKMKAERLKK
jgi:hypothetical protein